MQRAYARIAVVIIFACACGHAVAAPFSANIAVSTDDAGGRGIDADFSVSPGEHVTVYVGAGYSSGSHDIAELRGRLLSGGVSLHGERGGFSLGYDSFDDDTNYHAGTLGARAWLQAGDFELALLGRRREMNVELELTLPQRSMRRTLAFSALGAGVGLSFARGRFNAYALALSYDYDDDFDRFLELAGSPLLERRPRIELLLGSFTTQAQGAIDRQAAFGIERGFGRHALALDIAFVHDAVIDSDSASVALTYRRAQSARLDWSVSAGMMDSDRYGGLAFAGVAVGLAH
jgi:hypothetical protein